MEINDISGAVVDAAMKVHTLLGPGLLEATYQHRLAHELRKRGFDARTEVYLPVLYDGSLIDIGYRLDILVESEIITASLLLRKLGAYPRQNALAVALRELGRLERTLFTLQYLQSVELRRRINSGLNKGEARNALARAVFFNRLGEVRDRTIENQRFRASGLNLVVAAIVLWNTVYLERAIQVLRSHGHTVADGLLPHLSPIVWDHINLTGDYFWKADQRVKRGRLRPLRHIQPPLH